jgi:hypothetical protein
MFLGFFVAFLSHVSEFRGNTSDYDRSSFICSFVNLWYSPSNYKEGLKMSLLNNKESNRCTAAWRSNVSKKIINFKMMGFKSQLLLIKAVVSWWWKLNLANIASAVNSNDGNVKERPFFLQCRATVPTTLVTKGDSYWIREQGSTYRTHAHTHTLSTSRLAPLADLIIYTDSHIVEKEPSLP